jgi:KDO2-lipid IV(A) lauroyltransferase
MHILHKAIAKALEIFFSLLGRIPRKWARHFGNVLGNLWYFLDKKHRNVALTNLNYAYGQEKKPAEIEKLARQVFENIAQIPLEICWSMRLGLNDFLPYCDVKGEANLKDALKKGRGVLFFSAHMGNWEFLSFSFGRFGFPVSGIYRPIKSKPINMLIYNYRTRFGAKLVPKKHSMRNILRSLDNNECVGMLLDQDAGSSGGVFVDFFGRPACTNKGLALLALKTGAPVIPAFVTRNGLNFRIEFGKEIPLIKTGEKSKDIAANTQQYNTIIEECVRQYPEQWFWVHRRWKSKPPT